jgi:His/Glu/Gln/Arg/opine family amino acid ABC transporter permease subunit
MAEAFLLIAAAIGTTLVLTVSAAAIGIVLGAPLVLLARSRSVWIRGIYQVFVHVVRGVPALVWLFIAFFGLAELGIVLPALASAVITLGIIAVATMAEIYRGGLTAIRQGQYEAGWALSLGRWSLTKDVVFPQLFRAVSPTTASYIVGLLKDSALASTIGVAEIVYVTGVEVQSLGHGLELFLFAGAIYLALSVPLGAVSRIVQTRLARRYAVV